MKTRILITIGDINGIGPEIILKTLNRPSTSLRGVELTIVTPVKVLEYYYRLLHLNPMRGKFQIISIGEDKVKIEPGKITKQSGFISGLAIKTAVEHCLPDGKAGRKKDFDAIVTSPISKKALNLGGFNYPGHTEMLTDLCGADDSVMFMVSSKMKIGFASTHPPLKYVSKLLTKELLLSKLDICYHSLKKDFGISKPSIGVLSFNPHAGESGQIGNEEIDIISPAIKKIKTLHKDINIKGPFPSDAYFGNKTYEEFDLTFAIYHDQGLIPFKMIAGRKGINYTSGLSIVRTSPDHGTAYDIAGKNIADETSLVEAIKWADRIYKIRNEFKIKRS